MGTPMQNSTLSPLYLVETALVVNSIQKQALALLILPVTLVVVADKQLQHLQPSLRAAQKTWNKKMHFLA
jgi:hypothetical protein